MINGQIFFDQPMKNDLRTYDNIWKDPTDQGDNYTIVYYIILTLKNNIWIIAIDFNCWSKSYITN